ncbi:hypothetical protein ACLOAV_001139 [Pseudogymnoascus australis]
MDPNYIDPRNLTAHGAVHEVQSHIQQLSDNLDLAAPIKLAARGGIYEDQDQCQWLLRNLDAVVALEILPSEIHGSGLFTKQVIPEGAEIFRSTPLVSIVGIGQDATVCDYCYASSPGMFAPDGNFRDLGSGTDIHGNSNFEIKSCVQCGVCAYCSEDCRIMAWAKYHSYECDVLRIHPSANSWTRMLYRLLSKQKLGHISDQAWAILPQIWGLVGERHPAVSTITEAALYAQNLFQPTFTNISVELVLCRIIMNAMPIHTPGEDNRVTMFDLVASLANHSCDPNAFVFHEGRQLRMRSLKPLNPGDEITLSYVNLRAGMIPRGIALRNSNSFVCRCDRCEKESKYLLSLARNEGFDIKQFAKVESEFDEFKKGACNSKDTINKMKASLANLTRTMFPTRPWPLNLYPMGSMQIVFAALYTNSDCHDTAAIHSLKGCLAETFRSGHIWVNHLHTLLTALRALMLEEEIAWVNSPGTQVLRDYFNGVLDELLVQSRK